jgi:hypothetical protein
MLAGLLQMISVVSETLKPVDLGVALHPEDLPVNLAVPRTWQMRPHTHRLSYGLGVSEETEIVVSYDLYKAGMNVRPEGDGYRHQAPMRCLGDLRCVYEELARSNGEAVVPIAERFLTHARLSQFDAPKLASLIITYVQSIEYQLVKDDPYGLVPPALVVNSTGDCDSKGLLAMMLLRLVGIDAVLLESNMARHAIVGVGLPIGSDRMWHQGRSYAVVEVTATNWPIGRMPPKYASLRDWKVVPVRFSIPAMGRASEDG